MAASVNDLATVPEAPERVIRLDRHHAATAHADLAPSLRRSPAGGSLAPHPVAALSGSGGLLDAARWQLATKRALDVAGSLALLTVLAPVFLIVAAAITVTSRGGALYRQERCGERGRRFTMLKFRSMYRDADERLAEVVDLNECQGPVFKMRNDPRVTPVGRVIRKLSLDELPQLVNVLRGEMSLVGPRPPLPREVAQYTARQRGRLAVRPGITCTWQVSGRSEVDFDTWIEMDLAYITHWSLALDVKLLLLTLPAVVSARGAY